MDLARLEHRVVGRARPAAMSCRHCSSREGGDILETSRASPNVRCGATEWCCSSRLRHLDTSFLFGKVTAPSTQGFPWQGFCSLPRTRPCRPGFNPHQVKLKSDSCTASDALAQSEIIINHSSVTRLGISHLFALVLLPRCLPPHIASVQERYGPRKRALWLARPLSPGGRA